MKNPQPLDLKDLAPLPATLRLAPLKDVELNMRPFDLGDKAWALQEIGTDFVARTFSGQHPEVVARICFRLLDVGAREHFAAKAVRFVNEEGDTAEGRLGGYQLLMRMVVGREEEDRLIEALATCMGLKKALDKAREALDAGEAPAEPPVPLRSKVRASGR